MQKLNANTRTQELRETVVEGKLSRKIANIRLSIVAQQHGRPHHALSTSIDANSHHILFSKQMSHKAKKKHHNGFPPKQPVLSEAHKLIKAESLLCPTLSVVLDHFNAGDYDPDYLFKFSGFVEDSKFLHDGVQRLTLQDPEKKTVVGIISTYHSFDLNTYVTIYGWLGLTSISELSLMVQLLEFDFPSENEPNFIDPTR